MDTAAWVSSQGQVTVPKVVRDVLVINRGDQVMFWVEGNRAVLARKVAVLAPAGTIRVPWAKRDVACGKVLRTPRAARVAARHGVPSSTRTCSSDI